VLTTDEAQRTKDYQQVELLSARDLAVGWYSRNYSSNITRVAVNGPELDICTQTEIIETLSRADASVGWCVMIGSDSGSFSGFLEEATARSLYPDLDAVTAGWVVSAGTLEVGDGGYRLSGRWSFGSGSTHLVGHARSRRRAVLRTASKLAGCFVHTATTCRSAVQLLVDTVGTAAIRKDCPLERQLRHLNTMVQHVLVRRERGNMPAGCSSVKIHPSPYSEVLSAPHVGSRSSSPVTSSGISGAGPARSAAGAGK
jgi:hypothetical protein